MNRLTKIYAALILSLCILAVWFTVATMWPAKAPPLAIGAIMDTKLPEGEYVSNPSTYDHVVLSSYVGTRIPAPLSPYWLATGNGFAIQKGEYREARFIIWEGAISESNVIIIGLYASSATITPDPNNPIFYNSGNSAAIIIGSCLAVSQRHYLMSPWFDLPASTNFISIMVQGDGYATIQPQEQFVEVTADPNPPPWA